MSEQQHALWELTREHRQFVNGAARMLRQGYLRDAVQLQLKAFAIEQAIAEVRSNMMVIEGRELSLLCANTNTRNNKIEQVIEPADLKD